MHPSSNWKHVFCMTSARENTSAWLLEPFRQFDVWLNNFQLHYRDQMSEKVARNLSLNVDFSQLFLYKKWYPISVLHHIVSFVFTISSFFPVCTRQCSLAIRFPEEQIRHCLVCTERYPLLLTNSFICPRKSNWPIYPPLQRCHFCTVRKFLQTFGRINNQSALQQINTSQLTLPTPPWIFQPQSFYLAI